MRTLVLSCKNNNDYETKAKQKTKKLKFYISMLIVEKYSPSPLATLRTPCNRISWSDEPE